MDTLIFFITIGALGIIIGSLILYFDKPQKHRHEQK